MNTIWADRSSVHDDLSEPDDVGAWLEDVGLASGIRATSGDLEEMRTLRDALRRMAALATGDTRPRAASVMHDLDEAAAVVNQHLDATVAERLVVVGGSIRREPVSDRSQAAAGMAAVSAEALHLLTADDAPVLRACQAPGCVLYFVLSHHRREWCSVACGNRARAARHYRRHRDEPSS